MNGGPFTEGATPSRYSMTIQPVVVSDPDLIRMQLRTMFLLDRRGRLVAGNEPGRPAPPRIFMTTGRGVRVVRVRHDVCERHTRDWLACCHDPSALAAKLTEHAPIEREYRGPAFVLPSLEAASGIALLGCAGAPPLHPELLARGWRTSETGPYVGVVRDGHVVAVCYSSREGPGACEAGVETAIQYRGRGFASVAVQSWAAAVQQSGRVALYSTEWENAASQRLAARLGAHQYGENWHIT